MIKNPSKSLLHDKTYNNMGLSGGTVLSLKEPAEGQTIFPSLSEGEFNIVPINFPAHIKFAELSSQVYIICKHYLCAVA